MKTLNSHVSRHPNEEFRHTPEHNGYKRQDHVPMSNQLGRQDGDEGKYQNGETHGLASAAPVRIGDASYLAGGRREEPAAVVSLVGGCPVAAGVPEAGGAAHC